MATMSSEEEYDYRVWHYVAKAKDHPTTKGHGPQKAVDIDMYTGGGCPTCGDEAEVSIAAKCLCGAYLSMEQSPWKFGDVLRGIFAIPLPEVTSSD